MRLTCWQRRTWRVAPSGCTRITVSHCRILAFDALPRAHCKLVCNVLGKACRQKAWHSVLVARHANVELEVPFRQIRSAVRRSLPWPWPRQPAHSSQCD
eukprot:3425227-Rhodomonas_salina.1